MTTKAKKIFPFDLPPLNFFTLEVTPEDAAILQGGNELEQEAINLILEAWQENTPFGVKIHQRYGFTSSEQNQLSDVMRMQRSDDKKSMEFVLKIAGDLQKNPKEISEILEAMGADDVPDWFYPYASEAQEIAHSRSVTNKAADLLQSTLLIKRTIKEWTEDLTVVLPDAIQSQLTTFAAIEWAGKPKPPEPDLPEPSDKSDESLTTSTATYSLITA